MPEMYSVEHKEKEIFKGLCISEREAILRAAQDHPDIPVGEMTAEIAEDGQASVINADPLTSKTTATEISPFVKPPRKPRADKGQKRVKTEQPTKKRRTVYHLCKGEVVDFKSKDDLVAALGALDLSKITVINGGKLWAVQTRFALVQPEK